jgi:hypothetical protein
MRNDHCRKADIDLIAHPAAKPVAAALKGGANYLFPPQIVDE